MPISEIFLSIQGEGLHAGEPSVFLRTYYCNLTCNWCDTKYTWLNQASSKEGLDYKRMSPESIVKKVTSYGCRHLVLTGGEPLIHQEVLAPLLAELKREGFFIEVETNGTFPPTEALMDAVDCFNVSPKTSNSKVEESVRTRPIALMRFVQSGKAWFKFVVCDSDDLAEVEKLTAGLSIPRDRVMLMPEGTERGKLLERGEWLARACVDRGFRFSPRLQILLFGNKRGT